MAAPIIDELLCFIVNKLDILLMNIISQLCCSSFSESEIEKSKKLLYDLCADESTSRRITRKGKKNSANIGDIVKLLQEKSRHVATFVTMDLTCVGTRAQTTEDSTAYLKDVDGRIRQLETEPRPSSVPSQPSNSDCVTPINNDRGQTPATQVPSQMIDSANVAPMATTSWSTVAGRQKPIQQKKPIPIMKRNKKAGKNTSMTTVFSVVIDD
ncbi:hypothetical protein CAPTEDRAFT_203628 [Capitella teleta]|uniref:Uncharacterized protein n=1 Tax=Capitella teleta TaxID=283909 RepID=R7UIB3_CAPTE|nr:hypothetical protein CAPTEDRAFT_203628 [Capitella teleta]|eukprot:ELU05843.1 hypothetical protein CAPTEDRAFT_203628 [Capitella teleta]